MFSNFFNKILNKKIETKEQGTNTDKITKVDQAVQTQVSHIHYEKNKVDIKELPYNIIKNKINDHDSEKLIKYSMSVIDKIMEIDPTGNMLQGVVDRSEELNIWDTVEDCFNKDISIQSCIYKLNRVEIDDCYPYNKELDVIEARKYARKVLDEIIKRNPYGHLLNVMTKTNIWKIIEWGYKNNKSIDFVIDDFQDDI